MNPSLFPRIALAAVLSGCALAACDHPNQQQAKAPPPDASAGQKVDHALARTKEELARAGEQVKPTLERAGESIERAGEKIKPALERAGEKIKPAVQRAGDEIKNAKASDVAITASIKADYLKDPDLSVLKIDVDTTDGVVTLNGKAKDEAARTRAVRLAQAIKGVREVKNHLTIG
jgi:hypothetical protein